MSTAPVRPSRAIDQDLRERARRVIPNGMYGHLSTSRFTADYPQFFARGEGARVWDVDGREFIDLMCTFGPILLGHAHPEVDAVAAATSARGDVLNGPGPEMVELAEVLDDRGGARRLGDVRQERQRRHQPGGGRRASPHRPPQGADGPRLVPRHRRLGAAARVAGDDDRGSRQHRVLRLQRPGLARGRGARGRRGAGRGDRLHARTATTCSSIRSPSIPSSPGACARSATASGRC